MIYDIFLRKHVPYLPVSTEKQIEIRNSQFEFSFSIIYCLATHNYYKLHQFDAETFPCQKTTF